eukprot:symbB.v1.2.027856.t1/scaffold2872.1/size68408/7
MVGRGLNAMNLELPMSPAGVRISGENQVTQQALHQLKELQNVQGPAATREVLLRQHFRRARTDRRGCKASLRERSSPTGLVGICAKGARGTHHGWASCPRCGSSRVE